MDHHEFRIKAKEMVDFMADYLENIRDRRVYPDVQPGYLHKLVPNEAPDQPEEWDVIFRDVERIIMPGLVHWQSPKMHAYFPALTSYPSIMGEMLSSALNVLCFTWASSPAGTELETIAMNWLGKVIGLPECFLNEKDNSIGGGVIQTTASEATLVSLLAARTKTLIELSKVNRDIQSSELLGHLVCYCSDQAHSSVEKAGLIGLVRMKYIESDSNQSMRGDKLEEAVLSDKAKGLVPFWVCATLGTTGTVAFDNLEEVSDICEKYNIWLHVDAAYAGNAFVCPEFRHWLKGIDKANSIAFNPSKWLMVNFDCTAMWVKDSTALHKTFNVNPIYLRHENSGKAIDYMVGSQKTKHIVTENDESNGETSDSGFKDHSDNDDNYKNDIQLEDPDKKEYLHWQIPLSRRFRALKLWFVLRNYGVSGIQKHIRESVRLAQKFAALVQADARFELPQVQNLGLVAFRLKGDNILTERLLKRLNARGKIHMVPACFKNIYVIRFTVTSPRTTNQDILNDWAEIKTVASEVLIDMFECENGNINVLKPRPRISLKDTRETATFGTSLLLANSPMSPKIVNGTHAAICDYEQVLTSCAQTFAQLKMEPKDSPEMRRRIRGIKMCGKKFSLDSCMDMVQGLMMEGVKTLPECSEDEREDLVSNESSPEDQQPSSPLTLTSATIFKAEDLNPFQLPPTVRSRSKSIDISLIGLNLEDAKLTINVEQNEITITPTESKPEKTFNDTDESPDSNGKINVTIEKVEDDQKEYEPKDDDSKLTIKAPGRYIRKLIQQFSEGNIDNEDSKPEADRHTMKDRADAICKKCLHIKGKITKDN